MNTKPVLKWPGGKTQLLHLLNEKIDNIENTEDMIYVEPFLGGGAFFIDLAKRKKFKKYIINDINPKLINVYLQIRDNPEELIINLKKLTEDYLELNAINREEFYYSIREKNNYYDDNKKYTLERRILFASYFIFLNKTCYSGLYRENKKGEFNVPHARYVNPTIFDREQILNLSKLLNMKDIDGNKKVEIFNMDYTNPKLYDGDKNKMFIYFDPPYRPLNNSFSYYHGSKFDDENQIELSNLYKFLNKKGAKLLLNNSDPKNICINDDFFEDLYKDYDIERVLANRVINSNYKERKNISELLISCI